MQASSADSAPQARCHIASALEDYALLARLVRSFVPLTRNVLYVLKALELHLRTTRTDALA